MAQSTLARRSHSASVSLLNLIRTLHLRHNKTIQGRFFGGGPWSPLSVQHDRCVLGPDTHMLIMDTSCGTALDGPSLGLPILDEPVLD